MQTDSQSFTSSSSNLSMYYTHLCPSLFPAPLPYADTFSVPHTISSTSVPKSLPSVTHIPLLTRWADFGIWNEDVQALILHLGYLGHIVNRLQLEWSHVPHAYPSTCQYSLHHRALLRLQHHRHGGNMTTWFHISLYLALTQLS
jgi:hypothetical protein